MNSCLKQPFSPRFSSGEHTEFWNTFLVWNVWPPHPHTLPVYKLWHPASSLRNVPVKTRSKQQIVGKPHNYNSDWHTESERTRDSNDWQMDSDGLSDTSVYWIRLIFLTTKIPLVQCTCNHRSRTTLVCSSKTAKRTKWVKMQDIHIERSWLFCCSFLFRVPVLYNKIDPL